MLKDLLNRLRLFLEENPRRAQLIIFVFLLAAIPITVFAALTVQNLIQRASETDVVQIVDSNGNSMSRTSDPQVFLKIRLPPYWALSEPRSDNLIGKVYAQTSVRCFPKTCSDGLMDCIDDETGTLVKRTCTSPTPAPVNQAPTTTVLDPNQIECNPPNVATCPIGYTAVKIPTTGKWTCETSAPGQEKVVPPICSIHTQTPTLTPTPTSTPSSTPTPSVRVLKNLYIANKDTDGSGGGSDPLNIGSNFIEYLGKPIPWRLNSLIDGQTEASRIVEVTFFDGNIFVPFATTVTLVRPDKQTGTVSNVAVDFKCNLTQIPIGDVCHASALAYDSAGFPIFDGVSYEWGISSVSSIGTLEATQGVVTGFVAQNIGTGSIWVIARQGDRQERKSVEVTVVPGRLPSTSTVNVVDITGDNVITEDDFNVLVSQYGKRGSNLSADLNHDGIVDGIDYNILLRSR